MRRWALPWLSLAGAAPARTLAPARQLVIDVPVLDSLSVVLSTGAKAPLAWKYFEFTYSLTVPQEAIAAAVLAVVRNGYDVMMQLFRPEENFREVLQSGQTSAYADVPTEEAAQLILEVGYGTRSTNYTILVIRSTITSDFKFKFPDPAESVPPQGTLTGLAVFDGFGEPLPMEPIYFDPRRSQYLAFASPNTGGGYAQVRAVASKNDPFASLQLRVDGTDWEGIESGIRTRYIPVPVKTWLQLEVQVLSPTAEAAGAAPVAYQLLISREVRCHLLCRTCYGPEASHCLSCRAPLVLNNGSCSETACPPTKYYDWMTYQCQPCHETCAQCSGPGAGACTECPALFFLSPFAWESEAPCVIRCPTGQFAHPRSRRCRQRTAPVKSFYMQFQFRSTFQAFAADAMIQESVVNTTAFVLGLALSDVRAYKMELVEEQNGVVLEDGPPLLTVEVVSPFLLKAEADAILIDSWFGAFEVPVDEVRSLSWDQMHPPLPPLPVDPFLPTWVWGLATSAASGIVVLVPMYLGCFGEHPAQVPARRSGPRLHGARGGTVGPTAGAPFCGWGERCAPAAGGGLSLG
ncbi:unnamed protein product [Effrenium voratum]|nr:unnamed protein product [Effrenium voratum]